MPDVGFHPPRLHITPASPEIETPSEEDPMQTAACPPPNMRQKVRDLRRGIFAKKTEARKLKRRSKEVTRRSLETFQRQSPLGTNEILAQEPQNERSGRNRASAFEAKRKMVAEALKSGGPPPPDDLSWNDNALMESLVELEMAEEETKKLEEEIAQMEAELSLEDEKGDSDSGGE